MQKLSAGAKLAIQDDSELLYMTIAVVVTALFATGFHADLDRTVTMLAPEGSSYPFPAQTRLPAAKLAAAVGGFLIGIFFWTVFGKLRWYLIKQLLTYRDWIFNPKSLKTRAWYFSLSSILPRKRFLYTFQHVLPKYPLPPLDATCAKMLDIVEPLVSEKEFQEIKQEMKNFQKGVGPELQKVLEKRYNTEANWVADLWDKYAYLQARTPIYYTNFCNQGALIKTDISPSDYQPQCARAASLTYQYMRTHEMIQSRTLAPLLVQDLVPICSYRYRYLYACTRIPGTAMDELMTFEESKHIIIFRKGIMFRLDLYATDTSGKESLLAPEELQTIFESIINGTADVTETQMNPSVFTGQNRTLWAQEREQMMQIPVNKASLNDAESAVFHLVLEDTSPEGLKEECYSNLCGSGLNRWFDKSLTIAVYENGVAGGNMEHTTADATLTSRMLEYAWGKGRYRDGQACAEDSLTHPIIPVPTKLKWNLSQYTSVIPKYLEQLALFKMNMDIQVLILQRGKESIKKLRISPDGFMQMALQLAFYRMHHTVPKTYETAMTRFFKYGRTETIRTVSKHSVAFTKAMDDPQSTKEECIKHLKDAISWHHQYKLEAMNGQAADRHMFGLYVASKFLGVEPKLFNHKILTDYDQLSTSQSPCFYDKGMADSMNLYPAGGAFPAIREDGYGVYYLFLGEKFMTVHITSYRSCPETNSVVFGQKFQEAINDIEKLLKR